MKFTLPLQGITEKMSKKFILAALPLMLGLGLILSSCTQESFAAPPASYVAAIPQVDLYQLQLDYSRDPGASSALYEGKRFYFGQVRAEQVSSIFDVHSSENYILVNNVKFKPQASADMKGIIQGTLFEVVGDVLGVQSNYVVVVNCWFRVVSGGGTFGTGGAAY